MFAILAVSIVGGKLGYCTNLPNGISKYGIGITKVRLIFLILTDNVSSVLKWVVSGKLQMLTLTTS